ncbi:MAG: outer membrane protein assembly factor BamA, partial [Deltaproteobacteria bacterium]|nr:outer membrane protein assembly factor BamA [Deltaproteobacteria bacterium]
MSGSLGAQAQAQLPPGYDQPSQRPAQMPRGGRGQKKPADEVKKAPPPKRLTPMTEEMESARNRAQERGVLRGAVAKKNHIFEIHIVGAQKVEADAVLVNVQSRVDDAPDARVIAGDIKRIFGMGLFADVLAKSKINVDGSIVLTYVLVEKPAIGQVRFEGNDDVSGDDIEEIIDLKAFQVLSVPRIRRNVEKIQKLYVDKGFFLAEVDYDLVLTDGKNAGKEVEQDPFFFDTQKFFAGSDDVIDSESPPTEQGDDFGKFIDVVFKIQEHAKVKVENINIVGNVHISEDALKEVLRTRENHPLGIMTEWGTYKEELAEIDLLAIEALYQDQGFINIQVGKPQIALSQDKTRMNITIPITEGEQFKLSSFDVQGELLVEDPVEYYRIRRDEPDRVVFLKSALLAETRVHGGELFARSKVAQDILAITDRYRDRGHAYVNIIPDTQVDPDAKTLSLTLRVQAGPRVRVERINITGNTKTQDRVIRRELRLYEGEYYSATDLRRSEQRVNALGFFETVEMTSKQGTQPDRMIVVVNIKEKATGQFQLGAGFSGAESFIFQGQISQNNFLGRGHTISGSVQWSRLRQMLDFRFVDPYAFYIAQEPMTFALSLFNTQRNYIDFRRNSLGADITLGYPLGRPFNFLTKPLFEYSPRFLLPYVPDLDNFHFYLTLNGERVEIAEQSFAVNLFGLNADVPRYTSSIRASLIFDQRNNRLFPSQGYYLQMAAEFASPFMGSGLAPGAETFVANGAADISPFLADNLPFLKPEG